MVDCRHTLFHQQDRPLHWHNMPYGTFATVHVLIPLVKACIELGWKISVLRKVKDKLVLWMDKAAAIHHRHPTGGVPIEKESF